MLHLYYYIFLQYIKRGKFCVDDNSELNAVKEHDRQVMQQAQQVQQDVNINSFT